jgi:hypothetical protein
MPRVSLDDSTVNRYATTARFTVLWDTDLYGFGCYAGPRHAPCYFVHYRTPAAGLWCRRNIGSTRKMSCDQARRMAQEVIGRSAPQQLKRKPAPRSS